MSFCRNFCNFLFGSYQVLSAPVNRMSNASVPTSESPTAPNTWGPSIPFSTMSPSHFVRGKADVMKLVMSGLMFVAVLAATLGPAIGVRRYRSQPRAPSRYRRLLKTGISCMNCFAGGVFLATGILDVLPDAIENVQKGFKAYKITVDYPIANLCLLIGFFILLTIEQVSLNYWGRWKFSASVCLGNRR